MSIVSKFTLTHKWAVINDGEKYSLLVWNNGIFESLRIKNTIHFNIFNSESEARSAAENYDKFYRMGFMQFA